jgi:hypothetical protein
MHAAGACRAKRCLGYFFQCGARRGGLPRLHRHTSTRPRDIRWPVPTGAPRDGPQAALLPKGFPSSWCCCFCLASPWVLLLVLLRIQAEHTKRKAMRLTQSKWLSTSSTSSGMTSSISTCCLLASSFLLHEPTTSCMLLAKNL